MPLLHGPKIFQWSQSPGLKGLVGLTNSRKNLMGTRAKQNRVAVENTKLNQNEDEDCLLKFSKEHQWVFA